jgi:NADPH-dependent curcumin reductase CurA
MTTSREVRLKSRPHGMPVADNFEVASVDLAAPTEGQVRVRNRFMSVDPYMRGRMYDRASYVPPFKIGDPLQGHAVGEIVESHAPGFAVGDMVSSMLGWREEFVVAPAALQAAMPGMFDKLPPLGGVSPSAVLGVLGMPGLTAYSGLLEIGKPQPGETVFVSGGAGAVGSVVAQIAKIKGCTVVATAGSAAKCDWLRSVGVDHAVNYKDGNLLDAVRAAAPKGIDVYFDNVGGEHLEVAMEVANPFARFAECGMISMYNDTTPAPGPRNMAMIVGKRLNIRGFIVSDFGHLRDQFMTDMGGWIADGRVKWEETVMDGIDAAPAAFLGLFTGGNTGKMVVSL